MIKMIFKLKSGIACFLFLHHVHAMTLSYQGVDAQQQPIASEITVTEQIGNLFLLHITGGMPDIDVRTETPYVRALNADISNNLPHQAQAIFSEPVLYIFAPGQIFRQKLITNVNNIYVFLQQDQEHFKLSHFFREGVLCEVPTSNETGLFLGDPVCQFSSEKVSFNNPVVYQLSF